MSLRPSRILFIILDAWLAAFDKVADKDHPIRLTSPSDHS